jgi:predicted nuclease of restriction endonuclease-like (RecB) superfamily
MNFNKLISQLNQTHVSFQQNALQSVNLNLTVRNWLIGFYIVEFEQSGKDRARYGEKLIEEIASALDVKGLGARNLKLFRQFYLVYPQVGSAISSVLAKLGFSSALNFDGLKIQTIENEPNGIMHFSNAQFKANKNSFLVSPHKLIELLSFTHLVQLFPITDPLKRTFYELECIKGNWKVEELRRQISTLYFERSGLSLNPGKLSEITQSTAQKLVTKDFIKSPFTFEFLGLKSKDIVYESDLEQALIDNLEEFLLELGHGFCFEAKQKRITIGGKYYFIDLVFYHRVLKCHVLVELKMKEVEHENIGQLKTYINYYKKNITLPDDNPPVGILLVTENDKELVEYAVADSDQDLFVSKYILELPSKSKLQDFIRKEISSL